MQFCSAVCEKITEEEEDEKIEPKNPKEICSECPRCVK
jgi:hypothetical protein